MLEPEIPHCKRLFRRVRKFYTEVPQSNVRINFLKIYAEDGDPIVGGYVPRNE
jgi:hypothetical protein